ncbi:S-layer homology domain-containing protein [Nostoc sp. CHAB 5844]|nr:S-layer homology domain-containing protein [Nostoc sp. CHAB 5844]
MFKMPSITGLIPFTTVTATLALTTIITSPSKTLSQTPSQERSPVPQRDCLSRYPNDTYQGSRPLTRNEFAAGFDTCLNQLNQIIPVNRADLATKEDLEILLQRQRQLNQQLRELNERVDPPSSTK